MGTAFFNVTNRRPVLTIRGDRGLVVPFDHALFHCTGVND